MNGISNNEKANLLMEQASFKELLADGEHRDLLDNIVSLKANHLFAYAEQNVATTNSAIRCVMCCNVTSLLTFDSRACWIRWVPWRGWTCVRP